MDIELRAPDRDLIEALARLAAGPANIRKTLNRDIRAATAPIQEAMARAIMGIESKGTRGGGSAARRASGTTAGGRLPRHTGLRAHTAHALETKITYRGFRTGVRIRINTSKMPENQRNLPQAMNTGHWRHPFLGNRNIWIEQVVTPPGWFDRTASIHGPQAVTRIAAGIRSAVEQLQ